MCKYKVPTILVHFIGVPSAHYIWVLYNKDGIPIARSCRDYKGRDKAENSALQMNLGLSHESIELELN